MIRLRALAGTTAQVSVCRVGGAETAATCAAGQDNDCNGLAGRADPACASLLPAPAVLRPVARPWRQVRRPPRGAAALRVTAASVLPLGIAWG